MSNWSKAYESDLYSYVNNNVLPENKTIVFFIFSLVKIGKSYGPNVPDVRVRPKIFSARFLSLVSTKIWRLFGFS